MADNINIASIFDVRAIDIDGNECQLSKFKGKKAYLIVNVASKCGFTSTNYKQLYEIYKNYSDKGLEILAFPSNQFFNQEPFDEPAIKEFVKKEYNVDFPMFKKIYVNGEKRHDLYKYLANNTPGFQGYIQWNFAKFLVNAEGKPVQYYEHKQNPVDIVPDILKLLNGE
ncbi:glutathione peroxidase (macronuclear) [Tetrahymena thermophila SB210]|uniref:Glutathione peroxidase n=1 Tax=Tetrahymena thermophila (strain SB210) TaxID=312017 RepID=Q22BL2_TETTS|nr:glutathione peroxidase [Tetrahymena thermophila SB210]EAR82654.2 glutathione peroxidase [Tetrahymena thermophila SB210]|eukprot:XP_001030317.2 glutathione peroxidase [Tetrahymena thermophila SB210]